MRQSLLKILACPKCGQNFKQRHDKLICLKQHTYMIRHNVPILVKLNNQLKSESLEWDEKWKTQIKPIAMKAYEKNMDVFTKLKFWEESPKAAKYIPTKKGDVVLDLA